MPTKKETYLDVEVQWWIHIKLHISSHNYSNGAHNGIIALRQLHSVLDPHLLRDCVIVQNHGVLRVKQ